MGKKKLNGLILSGGKSTRMGTDKGLLEYHGKPQRDYLFELLESHCDKVFYSIRQEQQEEFEGFPVIVDQDKFRGPFNGILSSHDEHTDVAWLVLACDLPLLDSESIRHLIIERDASKAATSYATRKAKLPEPLVTIWEPDGLKAALAHMQTAESSCPRKFLINSDIKIVYPENDEVLYNANSIEEFKQAQSILNL